MKCYIYSLGTFASYLAVPPPKENPLHIKPLKIYAAMYPKCSSKNILIDLDWKGSYKGRKLYRSK